MTAHSKTIYAADLFAGCGGTSSGLMLAAEEQGLRTAKALCGSILRKAAA